MLCVIDNGQTNLFPPLLQACLTGIIVQKHFLYCLDKHRRKWEYFVQKLFLRPLVIASMSTVKTKSILNRNFISSKWEFLHKVNDDDLIKDLIISIYKIKEKSPIGLAYTRLKQESFVQDTFQFWSFRVYVVRIAS